jgi:hypothetical protein
MAGVLAIDSEHDIVAQYGRAFRRCLVFDSFHRDFPQHTLTEQNTRNGVDNALAAQDIDLVTGSGHGDASMFSGANGEEIFGTFDDLSLASLSGKIVHLLSCSTALSFGRAAVAAGARAFWGYIDEFRFFCTDPPPLSLQDDDLASAFIGMDIIVLCGLLRGHAASKIKEDVEEYVLDTYQRMPLLYPDDPPTAQALLNHNYTRLVGPFVTWGNPAITLP